MLNQRIAIFTALPIRSPRSAQLASRLKEIGRMEGATASRRSRLIPSLARRARRGSARHGVSARCRDRLRHHGAEAVRRKRRAGAALQYAADGRDSRRADPDLRAGVRRAFQSGRKLAFALRRDLPWSDGGALSSLYRCAARSSASWWRMLMFELPIWQVATTVRAGPGQWLAEFVASFGLMLTIFGCAQARAQSSRLRGRPLHHRRILVHRVDVVCQSGRNHRPVPVRHIRRDCACPGSLLSFLFSSRGQ